MKKRMEIRVYKLHKFWYWPCIGNYLDWGYIDFYGFWTAIRIWPRGR